MQENEEKAYAYWFYNVPGMNGKKGRELYARMGNAREIYQASMKQLSAYADEKTAENIMHTKDTWDILAEYESLKKQKIHFTGYGMKDYPERLSYLADAPAVLYYKGKLPENNCPAVAIIGARMCSEYGRQVATWFGSKLGEKGIQIISGMAMGIDGISQEAALHVDGKSFAVLGCGVDICYPKSNMGLYERLLDQGGIISEYHPGTMPKPQLFPPRNRIISGLADLVLVIEAKEKSGTFITVDMALEQGKEVYVVPGRITDALSRGCLRLMKQGAGAALSPEDILEALYYEEIPKRSTTSARNETSSRNETSLRNETSIMERASVKEEMDKSREKMKKSGLSRTEEVLYDALDICPRSLEDIHHDFKEQVKNMEKCGLEGNIRETMELLTGLCIKGVAEQLEIGMFRKK